MKKGLIVMLLTTVLLLAFSFSALAVDKEYTIDGSAGSIEDFMDEVDVNYTYHAGSRTLTLNEDIDLNDGSSIYTNAALIFDLGNKQLTLDLNGHDIKGKNGENALIELLSGTLTIEDSEGAGGIYHDDNGEVISVTGSNSQLIIEGGTISDGSNYTTITVYDGALLTVNGGEIDAEVYDGIYAEDSEVVINGGEIYAGDDGIEGAYSKITINGGYMNVNYGIYAPEECEIIINDCEIYAEDTGLYVYNSDITIHGGYMNVGYGIYAPEECEIIINDCEIYAEYIGLDVYDCEITIHDGYINTGDDGIEAEDCKITINGGEIYAGDDGIYAENCDITINGGEIDAEEYGIYADGGELTLSGKFYIYGGGYGIYLENWDGTKSDQPQISFYRAAGEIDSDGIAFLAFSGYDYIKPDLSTSQPNSKMQYQQIIDDGDTAYISTFSAKDIADYISKNEDFDYYDDFFDALLEFSAANVKFLPISGAEFTGLVISGVGAGVVEKPFISGYTDGSFRPDNNITRAEAAKILTIAAGKSNADNAGLYPDIDTSAWYAPYVTTMSREGWLKGYPDGNFRPGNNMTIAEFIAVVCRINHVAEISGSSSYNDIGGNWAEGYIKAAEQKGWLNDFAAAKLNPGKAITRLEAVLILNQAEGRYAKSFVSYGPSFSDIAVNHPHYDAILRAASEMM
jgi:hypothetical protein